MDPRERGELEQFIDNVLEDEEELAAGGAEDTLEQVAKQANKDTITEVVKTVIGTQAMGYLKGLRAGREQDAPELEELERIDDMIDQREEKIREMFGTEKSGGLFGL